MKKLFLIVFLFSFCFLLFRPAAWADVIPPPGHEANSSWFVQSQDQWDAIIQNAAETGQQSLEPFIMMNIQGVAHTIINALGGVTTEVQTPTGMIKQRQGGAISVLAGLTGALYTNPPASSVEYLADLGSSLGLVKPAYAQGTGFNAFSPLLGLWKTLRDLAYLVFVIIFVVIGLMVMFRKRIDPRTVVTVQEALPKVVMTLILITFSYAIVGLLIDLMQLVNVLAINTFLKGPAGGVIPNPSEIQKLITTNVLNLTWSFMDSTAKLGAAASGVVLKGVFSGLVDLTVNLIFKIALFFIMFKIFFMLLSSYVSIVLGVILSPLQILMSALPGEKNNPFGWIKNLLADVVVFPVSLVMFLIAARFTVPTADPWGFLGKGGVIGLSWAPPLIGDWSAGGGVGPLLGFGIIMAIPSVGHAIKEALEVKENALGAGVEKEIKGGASFIPGIGGFMR